MAWATGSSWSFPDDVGGSRSVPGSFTHEQSHAENIPRQSSSANSTADAARQTPLEPEQPPRQRHYRPRTCRICLEEVLPTFDTPVEGWSGMFEPSPQIQYKSQDPSSGRLIRPCKCKGSQRYVHEGCLQDWRHSDPAAFGMTRYWKCPTCHFQYRLERMVWSRWISSTATQILLTLLILFAIVFLLGFVADPLLNLYFDPVGTLTTNPFSRQDDEYLYYDDEPHTWGDHVLKGFASLGLLGFVKYIIALGPWNWYQLRNAGLGRGGRAGNGRDRLENISWYFVAIGVATFLYAIWKAVRAWSKKTLQKASDRVADVQGDDDEDEAETT